MRIHHDKHHAAYVGKLNDAVGGTDLESPVDRVDPRQPGLGAGRQARRGAEPWRRPRQPHPVLDRDRPERRRHPLGRPGRAIDAAFGSFDGFQAAFTDAATTRFGSGWAWLVVKNGGGLAVYSTANQDSPLSQGDTPILGIDVWEHAYYLNYQNRRPDYITAFYNAIDWAAVGERYAAAS